jgi:hypothetical protein
MSNNCTSVCCRAAPLWEVASRPESLKRKRCCDLSGRRDLEQDVLKAEMMTLEADRMSLEAKLEEVASVLRAATKKKAKLIAEFPANCEVAKSPVEPGVAEAKEELKEEEGISILPCHILSLVLSTLSMPELAKVARTCTQFNACVKDVVRSRLQGLGLKAIEEWQCNTLFFMHMKMQVDQCRSDLLSMFKGTDYLNKLIVFLKYDPPVRNLYAPELLDHFKHVILKDGIDFILNDSRKLSDCVSVMLRFLNCSAAPMDNSLYLDILKIVRHVTQLRATSSTLTGRSDDLLLFLKGKDDLCLLQDCFKLLKNLPVQLLKDRPEYVEAIADTYREPQLHYDCMVLLRNLIRAAGREEAVAVLKIDDSCKDMLWRNIVGSAPVLSSDKKSWEFSPSVNSISNLTYPENREIAKEILLLLKK